MVGIYQGAIVGGVVANLVMVGRLRLAVENRTGSGQSVGQIVRNVTGFEPGIKSAVVHGIGALVHRGGQREGIRDNDPLGEAANDGGHGSRAISARSDGIKTDMATAPVWKPHAYNQTGSWYPDFSVLQLRTDSLLL